MRFRIWYIWAAVLLLSGCSREISFSEDARLGENIVIDGAEVSGLSVSQAREALEAAHEALLENMGCSVDMGEGILTLPGKELAIAFDTDTVLRQALGLYPYSTSPRSLETPYTVGREALRANLAALAADYDRPAQDASIHYEAGKFTYTEGTAGSSMDIAALANALAEAVESGNRETVKAMRSTLEPGYTMEEAREDTSLISQYSTSFAGSTYGKSNRVFNIQKAAGCIDGVVLQPGESFDMNAVLGDRNAENGWKEATGIRYGAYVQEYGGGVCQVSSTLYNAVLMADLQVTEREHHSWPLGYVDIGRDATISTGGPNFCFVNSSEAPVYISALVDTGEKTITVRIYGRPLPDGISIRLRSRKTGSIEDPGDRVVLDESLPPGSRVVERESRAGSTAETYKLYYDGDGNLLREELVTKDKYRAIEGIVHVSADLYGQ